MSSFLNFHTLRDRFAGQFHAQGLSIVESSERAGTLALAIMHQSESVHDELQRRAVVAFIDGMVAILTTFAADVRAEIAESES